MEASRFPAPPPYDNEQLTENILLAAFFVVFKLFSIRTFPIEFHKMVGLVTKAYM